MQLRFIVATIVALLASPSVGAGYAEEDDPTPSVELGAVVYAERCVLCHGSQGMGEGPLPLRIRPYPDTTLVKPIHAHNRQEILDVVAFGGARPGISVFMPPFGKELTWTQIESVSDFITLLRADRDAALGLLNIALTRSEPSLRLGQQVFASRCVLCHGKYGEGDGRMTRIITAPPPADLTASRLADDYLQLIISKGGEAVDRSKHMPPWGEQLSTSEIAAVILYLKSIRDE